LNSDSDLFELLKRNSENFIGFSCSLTVFVNIANHLKESSTFSVYLIKKPSLIYVLLIALSSVAFGTGMFEEYVFSIR
jgi:hypothetical protein